MNFDLDINPGHYVKRLVALVLSNVQVLANYSYLISYKCYKQNNKILIIPKTQHLFNKKTKIV